MSKSETFDEQAAVQFLSDNGIPVRTILVADMPADTMQFVAGVHLDTAQPVRTVPVLEAAEKLRTFLGVVGSVPLPEVLKTTGNTEDVLGATTRKQLRETLLARVLAAANVEVQKLSTHAKCTCAYNNPVLEIHCQLGGHSAHVADVRVAADAVSGPAVELCSGATDTTRVDIPMSTGDLQDLLRRCLRAPHIRKFLALHADVRSEATHADLVKATEPLLDLEGIQAKLQSRRDARIPGQQRGKLFERMVALLTQHVTKVHADLRIMSSGDNDGSLSLQLSNVKREGRCGILLCAARAPKHKAPYGLVLYGVSGTHEHTVVTTEDADDEIEVKLRPFMQQDQITEFIVNVLDQAET